MVYLVGIFCVDVVLDRLRAGLLEILRRDLYEIRDFDLIHLAIKQQVPCFVVTDDDIHGDVWSRLR